MTSFLFLILLLITPFRAVVQGLMTCGWGGHVERSFPGRQTKAVVGCVFLFSPVLPGTAGFFGGH